MTLHRIDPIEARVPEGAIPTTCTRLEVRGGEKPVHPAWILDLARYCDDNLIDFVFEGWGDWCPDAPDRTFEGFDCVWLDDAGNAYDTFDEASTAAQEARAGRDLARAAARDTVRSHPTRIERVWHLGADATGREVRGRKYPPDLVEIDPQPDLELLTRVRDGQVTLADDPEGVDLLAVLGLIVVALNGRTQITGDGLLRLAEAEG